MRSLLKGRDCAFAMQASLLCPRGRRAMREGHTHAVDPNSGFCQGNGIYYSKREAVVLPPEEQHMGLATFVLSQNQEGTALIDGLTGHTLSHRELRRNVMALGAALHALGIRQGDVVLVLSPNCLVLPSIYLAILAVGAVLTTANPLSTPGEVERQIRDSKPVMVFTLPHLLGKVPDLPAVLIGREGEQQACCVSSVEQLLHRYSDASQLPSVDIRQHDTATLLYSSGTTGKSKAVVSTHRNCIAIVAESRTLAKRRGVSSDVSFCSMPMFHVYGFFLTNSVMAVGGTMLLLPKFDLHKMLWAVERYRVTSLPASPPVLVALAKSTIAHKYDLSSLQRIASGGAPLGKELIHEFAARFPAVEVIQGYGLTETSGGVSYTEGDEEIKHFGTAGLLSANVEAMVIDLISGKPLPPNHKGELWLRGPTIMKGYLGNEEATAATLSSDGWLKTGDLCYIDDKGFLFVVDRLKELIKYKAFQVAPAELEEILLSHNEISDAAVIPYPDNEAGQIPMAYVVRKPDSKLSEKDVVDFVANQVSPYKKVRRVAFVSSIPKSPSGKILRKDLIQQALPSRF